MVAMVTMPNHMPCATEANTCGWACRSSRYMIVETAISSTSMTASAANSEPSSRRTTATTSSMPGM